MVQDRDIDTMEENRKPYMGYQMTWIIGHFVVWNLCNSYNP